MAILVHKCPHCLSDKIALHIVSGTDGVTGIWWIAHLRCPKCFLPSGARMLADPGDITMVQTLQSSGDPTDRGWTISEFWPDIPEPTIPSHLPPDVERVYLQAERNFPIEGNEEAAGTMYRKALDVGLKKIAPTLTGTLGKKLKDLAAAGGLTDNIAEWSDNIRDIGNDAAHDESPITREELEDLRNFSEMVLRYLFSLPNAVKKRRGEKLDWEEED